MKKAGKDEPILEERVADRVGVKEMNSEKVTYKWGGNWPE